MQKSIQLPGTYLFFSVTTVCIWRLAISTISKHFKNPLTIHTFIYIHLNTTSERKIESEELTERLGWAAVATKPDLKSYNENEPNNHPAVFADLQYLSL
jgi:hypothetical protein